MNRQAWEEKSRAAFERYLAELKTSLPANASLADIEKAMLKHSPAMMRETMEALAPPLNFPRSRQRYLKAIGVMAMDRAKYVVAGVI
jgi:hypothetical protein